MQAVLYVCHGSRVQAGVDEATAFIRETIPKVPVFIQEICFLELALPTIGQGVANCIAKGATSIAIVPILLLTANHLKIDIPEEIQPLMDKYPRVKFKIGKAFGIDNRLIESLTHRVEATDYPVKNEQILLIGRGSSDPLVQKDLGEIASLLQKKTQASKVETCFLYGRGMSFQEKIEQLRQQNERVFIVPYLLFSGLLKKDIEQKIQALKLQNQEIVLCNCLGYDENVRSVLVDRVREIIN